MAHRVDVLATEGTGPDDTKGDRLHWLVLDKLGAVGNRCSTSNAPGAAAAERNAKLPACQRYFDPLEAKTAA
ncbi:MAG: hypothetical protein ABJC33_08770, partial [Betaproteobacteria bacterium]